jgi:hypothetical protein
MAYINPGPGTANEVTLTLAVNGIAGDLVVPALQDMTVNNANDVFTWSQLDETAKLQVATTSTNSIACNIVLDETTFFGNAAATSDSAAELGVLGCSTQKTQVEFDINIGTKTISGVGYVTGLAPTVSADSPVWVTPVTLTVSGEYTVA